MNVAWKNGPVTGVVLGIVALAILGVVYWSNVQDRERYLKSRNFRLLAVLASQTEQLVQNRARMLRDAVVSDLPSTRAARGAAVITTWPAKVGEILRLATERESAGIDLTIEPEPAEPRLGVPEALVKSLPNYRAMASSDGGSLVISWRPPKKGGGDLPTLIWRMPAADVMRVVAEPKLEQGAFDTVALAGPDGRVVYAVGRRAAELHASSVAALLPTPTGKDGPDLRGFATTIAEQPVRVAGIDYRMFTQPCCRGDQGSALPAGDPAPGFVLVGLIDAESMRAASLAISPVLVLAGMAFVLAALVGWSYLKVALIGPQQRVTRRDVLQLGVSGVFGLALATILCLSTATYSRLSANVDKQLEELAGLLDERLSSQVESAAAQLSKMTDAMKGRTCAADPRLATAEAEPKDPCAWLTARWATREDLPAEDYPDFTAFALIDQRGMQRVKAASKEAAMRLLPVAERGYFQQALALSQSRPPQNLWRLKQCPSGCAIESHRSWTTGEPQVVIATAARIPNLPVAALAIPMDPILRPVLPPGFEFAIIDGTGQVHFHSDPQRNVHENLLVETDQNPRLRSLMAAHGAGTLNTSYWGRPYRAFLQPTLGPGWSIVTLHDKRQARALVLEWSLIALLMESGYLLLWTVLIMAFGAAGVGWLWPDPRRWPLYRALLIVYGVTLAVWLAVWGRVETNTLLWLGAVLPPAVWLITYFALWSRPTDIEGPRTWAGIRRDYQWAGTLLLVVTAAIPAASFFALSSDLHVEAYLKQRQIALAHAVNRSAACTSGAQARLMGMENVRYDGVFYQTTVTCRASAELREDRATVRRRHLKIEDYIPYLTSASIALRELMHPRSDDDAWSSERPDPRHLAVTVRLPDPGYRFEVSSPLPPLVHIRALGSDSRIVWVAIWALALLGAVAAAAYGIVRFLLRRVVLVDVTEPVRSSGHVLAATAGRHALVLSEDPAAKAAELEKVADGKKPEVYLLHLTPIVQANNVAAAWRVARRKVSDIGQGQRLVIPDLDDGCDDVVAMRRKMDLLEELMREPEQSVLLLSKLSKRGIILCVSESWKWSQETERWSKLIESLMVVDTRQTAATGPDQPANAPLTDWWPELQAVIRQRLHAWRQRQPAQDTAAPLVDWRTALLNQEKAACPRIAAVCRELEETTAFKRGSLTRDQIVEEIEERASSIYGAIWQGCDTDERIVLEHVARHGLASAASRRIVRRLLARGLLRKDPELRLMNRSFQRYVCDTECRDEVMALERGAGPSLWDRLRLPLGIAAVMSAAFLAATQREALDATLAMAAGVTTAVPVLVRLTNLLTQLGGRASEPRANA